MQMPSVMIVHITFETSPENMYTHGPVICNWQLYLASVAQPDFVNITLDLKFTLCILEGSFSLLTPKCR